MPTPQELLKMADETAAQIEEMERLLPVLREQEAALRKAAAAQAKSSMAIESRHERSILRHEMESSAYAEKAATPGRPSDSDHPFPVALGKLKPPVTLRQWAHAHKLSRSKVASWLLTGDGGRRIPRKYADEIRKDFGVPLNSWPNGIRED